MLIDITM